ncbi:MAG: T9SS type A sorting domain-containing protein [Bacteroidetes bacterium]|nr:T9SS type A sorting domain-containing protein [Bacteroidota bacterium]
MKVYPNLAAKNISIHLSFGEFKHQAISLKIQTSSGSTLFENNFIIDGKEFLEVIDISSLPKGLYLLTLKSIDGVWSENIIVY